jgi:hypothetical protein
MLQLPMLPLLLPLLLLLLLLQCCALATITLCSQLLAPCVDVAAAVPTVDSATALPTAAVLLSQLLSYIVHNAAAVTTAAVLPRTPGPHVSTAVVDGAPAVPTAAVVDGAPAVPTVLM